MPLAETRRMIRTVAWLPTLLVPAVALAVACSSAPPGSDGKDSDGSSGGTTSTGGAIGSGGVDQGSGGQQASGGSGSSTGGRGGLMESQCTDAYGCGVDATCYAPGTPPPALCGAPDWCGACSCPMVPPEPQGIGQVCAADMPCPEATDSVPYVAHICDESTGLCTQCTSNDDCNGGTGYCSAGRCFACSSDADCPEAFPRCLTAAGPLMFEFGSCRECRTTADCETGVCTIDGVCTPGCQSDAQCGPNRVCGAEQRCVPQSCQADTECSQQSSCSDQTCRAKACQSDASCPGGYCVSGSCYETAGACYYDTAG